MGSKTVKTLSNWLAVIIILPPLSYSLAQEPPAAKAAGETAASVSLSLIVTNENHAIDVLKTEDIAVREAGITQQVLSVSPDSRPIDYTIVIDNSGSFKFLLEPAITIAKYFITNNGPVDETSIVRFISSDKIETVQEFTADKAQLGDGLDTLYVESGQSAVIDATYLAVQHVAKYRRGSDRRRAVVILSDGEDRESYYTADKLIDLIRASDVQLFIIGIVAQLKPGGINNVREKAKDLMSRLTKESGGRVFFPKDFEELRLAAKEIAHDLHRQFLIRYQSTNSSPGDSFREVEVTAREAPAENKLNVHTRTGYFLNPPEFDGKGNRKRTKPPKKSG